MKCFLICLCFFCVSLDAEAQNWIRTNGPVEDDVLDLCIDSSGILYAITPLGVNRSTNRGEHWTRPFVFPLSPDSGHIVVARNGAIVVAVTSGIFVSRDSGNTFLPRLTTVINPITKFAISGNGRIFGLTDSSFWISDDHGATWRDATDSGRWKWLTPITIAASHDTIVAHAADANEIFCSIDNGNTWRSQQGLNPWYVKGIDIHPDGSWYSYYFSAIYRNAEHESEWDFLWYTGKTTTIDMMRTGDIFVCSDEGLQLLHGSTSTDVSADFEADSSGKFFPVIRVVADPRTNIYYAATRGSGVWKSTPALLNVNSERSPSSFHVTPNPACEHVTIEYTAPEPKPVTIKLYDILGRTLWKRTEDAVAGQNITYFDAKSLLPGAYLIVLEVSGEVQTRWITIKH